jgi:hypothetical protein
MAMPDRKHLVSTLKLTSSLALLALVLVVSVRLSGLVTPSPHPDSLRNDFTLAAGQPKTCLGAATTTDAVPKIKALPSENEEEEGVNALVGPRDSFPSFCSFRKIPGRRLIVPRSIPSLYPLRC